MSLIFVYDLTNTTAVIVYDPKTYFIIPTLRIRVQSMHTGKECTYMRTTLPENFLPHTAIPVRT